MKRHHIVAVSLLIFGGYIAHTRFRDGDMDGAIRTGIIFALFGVFAFFYRGKLRTWSKPVVIALPVVLVGLMAYYSDFMNGNTASAIIAGIVLILGGVLTLFQDKPFVKEKVRTWVRPIPYIALVVLFVMMLFLLFW